MSFQRDSDSSPPAILWLAVILFLLPVCWKLGASDSRYHMEQMSVLPSQETWLRMQQGEADAWRSPSKHEAPRIRKPPLLIWSNLLVWNGLSAETSTVEQRLYRARLMSAVIGLVGVLGTFLLGRLLYGTKTAALGALILVSMYTVLKQGRLASFDTHLLGWIPLAIFATLAFADHRPRHLRWGCLVLAIAASSAAVMTKGPVACVYLLPSLVLAKLMLPRLELHTVRLILPLALTSILYWLWLQDVLANVPNAKEILSHELTQPRKHPQPFYYYLIAVALIFPWSFLFLRGIPRTVSGSRATMFPLACGILILFLMSFAEAKRQRYAVPVLPFFALATALGVRELTQRGFEDRGRSQSAHPLEWAHAVFILLPSLLLPVAIPLQNRMIEWNWIQQTELEGASWGAVAFSILFILPVALWVAQATRKGDRTQVVLATAIWLSLTYTFAMHFYVESYHGNYRYRALAHEVHQLTREQAVFLIHPDGQDAIRPDDKFVFHSARLFQATPFSRTAGLAAGRFALVPEQLSKSVREKHPSWRHIIDVDEGKKFQLFAIVP